MTMLAWTMLALTVVGLVLWPFVHLALLWHGVEVMGDGRPTLGRVATAALVTGAAVIFAQLGVSCLGAVVPFVGPAIVSLVVAVAVRTVSYGAMLELPLRSAFGLALGVSVVSWLYAGVLLGVAAVSVWGLTIAA